MAKLPQGFVLPEETISPDGKYGVIVPDRETFDPKERQNSLVDVKTQAVIARLDVKSGSPLAHPQSYSGMSVVWSADSAVLVCTSKGKWEPQGMVAAGVVKGRVRWQVDVLAVIRKEMEARARASHADVFKQVLAGMHQSWPAKKNGLLLVVNVTPEKTGVEFRAGVTSDATGYQIEGKYKFQAAMEGKIMADGSVVFGKFQCWTPDEIQAAVRARDEAMETLKKELGKLPLPTTREESAAQMKYWDHVFEGKSQSKWPDFLDMVDSRGDGNVSKTGRGAEKETWRMSLLRVVMPPARRHEAWDAEDCVPTSVYEASLVFATFDFFATVPPMQTFF